MSETEQKKGLPFADADAAFEEWWGEPHSVPQEQKEGFRRAFRQGWCAHIIAMIEQKGVNYADEA